MPKEAHAKAPAKRTRKAVSKQTRSKVAAARKTTRKAPTRTTATGGGGSSIKTAIAFVIAVIVVGGTSVAIGMSDEGQINVNSTISQRASEQEASGDIEGSAATRAVNAQQTQNPGQPNGGLIGKGNKVTEQQQREARQAPAPATSTATSTATTTDGAATSTDPASDEAMDENETDASSADSATTTAQ